MEQNKQKPNYDLKSGAVETLAAADTEAAPEYSPEELNRYRTHRSFHIPRTAKVLFLKAWFAGAVCYFFLWGLGTYIGSILDMLFILGVALGMATDLLTNNVIRFIEETPGDNDRFLMVTKRGIVGFFLNILYSMAVLTCVYMTYNLVNLAIVGITGAADTVPLGVEPILFGILCMGFDMLFIGCKRLLASIIRDAKAAADAERTVH